jgi:hypothetical protein
MLEHLPDREMVASVTGDVTSTDLDETINRRVEELGTHDSWHACTSIDASERILNKFILKKFLNSKLTQIYF